MWLPFEGSAQEVSFPNIPPVNHLTMSCLNTLSTGLKAVIPSHSPGLKPLTPLFPVETLKKTPHVTTVSSKSTCQSSDGIK